MPLMFEMLERELGPRVGGARLSRRARHAHADERRAALAGIVGRTGGRRHGGRPPHLQPPLGRSGDVREAGRRFPPHEIAELTGGRLQRGRAGRAQPAASSSTTTSSSAARSFRTRSSASPAAPSICSPASPAAEIIHFTHWLGALITSYDVIGTMDTPVRAVIDRAASLLQTPLSLLALVVTHDGVAGVYLRRRRSDTWRAGGDALVAAPRRLGRQAVSTACWR